jgi:hypothetical protein
MKPYRTTITLIGFFLAALLALWWLDYSGVPTEAQRRLRAGRVLPQLLDVPEARIGRVEIVRDNQVFEFQRRGSGSWQMTRPIDVAADSSILDTLVRNLKDLRPSAEAGTIAASGEAYGLAPPQVVVQLWAESSSATGSASRPLAVLEVGKAVRDQRYVRAGGTTGIDVVDAKLLGGLHDTPQAYRELNLMPIATFQVTSLVVHRDGMVCKAERAGSGRWRLAEPITVPANGPKIESLLAALSSVRVVDGAKGFAADNVSDFTPFGLDPPQVSIELTTSSHPEGPLVLHVGKKPSDHPDRVYVRRGDQDDVVLVNDRFLSEIPTSNIPLRSQNVSEIDPGAVTEIQIDALKTTFKIELKGDRWMLSAPRSEQADTALVQSLLTTLHGLQTSEFLETAKVPRPELDPPVMTVKVWQKSGPARRSRSSDPAADRAGSDSGPLALNLRIGRHDVLRKTVFSRLEGDNVILALPDALLEVLPKNQYAYRDLGILALPAASVSRLTLVRDQFKDTILGPDPTSSTPNQWRMLAPVTARADAQAITQLLARLSDLRAESFAADSIGDGKPFGLDRPPVQLSWELESSPAASADPSAKSRSPSAASSGRLRIGKRVPGKAGSLFAALDGQPYVFTLGASAVQPMLAEFHDCQIFSFPAESVRRLLFHLPERTLAFFRTAQSQGGPADWQAEPGNEFLGLDLSRFTDLVKQIAQLRTPRFVQYDGAILPRTGLSRPRLTIELDMGEGKPPLFLRLGQSQGPLLLAAMGQSASGAVFTLPAAAWDALIQSLTPRDEIPVDPFAPE